jgi:hypothetical protein
MDDTQLSFILLAYLLLSISRIQEHIWIHDHDTY